MSKCPECGSGLRSDQDGYDECVNPKCGWTEWGATHSSPVRSKKMSKAIELLKEAYKAIADIERPCPETAKDCIDQALAALADTEAEIKRLKEQVDLLTLGLLQEKNHISAIKKQYSLSVMPFCENKPPECFSGYNACLSCKLREICKLLYVDQALKPPKCKTCGGSGKKPRDKHCKLGVCVKKHDRITCHPNGVQCEFYIPTKPCPDCKNEKVKNETM